MHAEQQVQRAYSDEDRQKTCIVQVRIAADDVESDSNGEEDGKEGYDGRQPGTDSNRWGGRGSSQLPSANTVVDALVLVPGLALHGPAAGPAAVDAGVRAMMPLLARLEDPSTRNMKKPWKWPKLAREKIVSMLAISATTSGTET